MVLRVQALSIVDAVAGDMRSKLFAGDLVSDAQLTEGDVASRYGVARPTAKASIEKLVAEGLLVRGANRSARVPVLGSDDVRDLYFARRTIEGEVVRQLARRHSLPAEATKADADTLATGDEAGSVIIESVTRFHVSLVNAVGSARLSRLFATLMGEMQLCMVQMRSRRLLQGAAIVDEHKAISAHIQAGDADAAVQALFDHLARSEERMVAASERTIDVG